MEMEGGPAKARGGRRKTRVCLCATAAALIAVLLLCLVLGLTVLKPKRPVTTVNSVSLSDLDVSLRGFGLSLNVSLAVDLSIRNPNKVGFKYQNSSALLYYRGDDVGKAPIPAGQISAGETLHLNLTLTVMADRFISNSHAFSDVVSENGGQQQPAKRNRIWIAKEHRRLCTHDSTGTNGIPCEGLPTGSGRLPPVKPSSSSRRAPRRQPLLAFASPVRSRRRRRRRFELPVSLLLVSPSSRRTPLLLLPVAGAPSSPSSSRRVPLCEPLFLLFCWCS